MHDSRDLLIAHETAKAQAPPARRRRPQGRMARMLAAARPQSARKRCTDPQRLAEWEADAQRDLYPPGTGR